MAEKAGERIAELRKYLLDHAPEFSFYQAILWTQLLHKDAAPVGHEGPADDECVRLRPSVSLSFPPSDVEEASLLEDLDKVRITNTFLGLYGSDSPLPYAYSEHITQISAEPFGERVRTFLDIFHHRLLSLLFRAWKKYRPSADAAVALETLHRRALSFIGYNHNLGLGGDTFPRLSEMRLQALRHRSVVGLQFLLKKRLGYGIEIQQLLCRVVAIPEDQRTRLGASNSVLGSSLVVGERITDRNKIRLEVEARDYQMFRRLLPGKSDYLNIEEVMASYPRAPIDYEVEVKLAPPKVPAWELGSRDLPLGQGIWLGRPSEGATVRWAG